MKILNLTADTPELQRIKDYLQENASDTLADKINNGTAFEKDGKPLINKKNLTGFMQYAVDEAKKLAEKNARYACIEDKTVFGWAIHYFEEDAIEGNLFYMDGTEYKPAIKARSKPADTPVATIKEAIKQPSMQFSLFDNLEEASTSQEQNDEIENAINGKAVTEDGEIVNYEDFDGDIDDEPEKEPIIAPAPKQEQKGNTLYQTYMRIQEAYPNSVIAIKLGDFYEVFGANAVKLAEEYDLTLTSRDLGLSERVPTIGFPYHSSELYFNKIRQKYDLIIDESKYGVKTSNLPKAEEVKKVVANDEIVVKLTALFGTDMEVRL